MRGRSPIDNRQYMLEVLTHPSPAGPERREHPTDEPGPDDRGPGEALSRQADPQRNCTKMRQPRLPQRLDERRGLGRMLRAQRRPQRPRLAQGLRQRRTRDYAERAAPKPQRSVGRIVDHRQRMLPGVRAHPGTGHAQPRPTKPAPRGEDARQPADTSAIREPHQQRLGLILCRVCGQDGGFTRQRVKGPISARARASFEIPALRDIHLNHGRLHISPCPITHHRRRPRSALWIQPVIHRDHPHRPSTQTPSSFNQRHRISATATPNPDRARRRQETFSDRGNQGLFWTHWLTRQSSARTKSSCVAPAGRTNPPSVGTSDARPMRLTKPPLVSNSGMPKGSGAPIE